MASSGSRALPLPDESPCQLSGSFQPLPTRPAADAPSPSFEIMPSRTEDMPMWVEANVKTAAASTTSGAASPAEEVRSSEPCLRKRSYQNPLPIDYAEMWMQSESMERASSGPRPGSLPFVL